MGAPQEAHVGRPVLGTAGRWAGTAAAPLAPFIAALVLAGGVLVATGRNPSEIFGLLLEHTFGSGNAVANTLAQTTPVLLTGLATAFAFRSGVFNIGVEGSLYVGAFAAAWVGFTFLGLPGPVLVGAAILLGAAVGGAWALVPGYLKARWQVDEVVTTLMLNFVAISLTSYLVNGPFLAVGTANSMSPLVAQGARLGSLAAPSQLTLGFPFALALAAAFWFMFRRTTFGYELRVAGDNQRFAAASGINLFRVVVIAMLVSGIIGGLAGGIQVLGVNYRFIDRFSPGYGFTGIAVALLGRNTAVGCVLAALFFGALSSGGATIQLFTSIPLDLIDVLAGTVMIFAVVDLVRLVRRH
jgi:simple sugar transport system permease protein